jgi:hypothetical protein
MNEQSTSSLMSVNKQQLWLCYTPAPQQPGFASQGASLEPNPYSWQRTAVHKRKSPQNLLQFTEPLRWKSHSFLSSSPTFLLFFYDAGSQRFKLLEEPTNQPTNQPTYLLTAQNFTNKIYPYCIKFKKRYLLLLSSSHLAMNLLLPE